MANYIATDAQLTATANAIRAKAGSSASLVWDASTGFADDIAAIATGFEVTALTASDFTFDVGKTYKSAVGKSWGKIDNTTKATAAKIANVSPGDIICYLPIYDSNSNLMSCRMVGREPNLGNVSETSVLSGGGIVTVGNNTEDIYFVFGYTDTQGITMTTEACQLFAVYWIHVS